MKGRCSGVSLFKNLNKYVSDKIMETLPGAKMLVRCSRKFLKREAPHYTCRKGSLTVEASVILPFLTCFFCFLLFYFRVMQVQLSVQNALEETGRSLALVAVKELEEPLGENWYMALAKGMLLLRLENNTLIRECVSGGALGVSLLTSEFEGDDIILNANYVMRFPIRLFGIHDFWVCQNTCYRKWNGWRKIAENEKNEIWVYVTEHGRVYHLQSSCPYLDLSIREISYGALESERNLNGETYDGCEMCVDEGNGTTRVYITDYGGSYHYVITCSGLKRTIYRRELIEVGGLPACSKCSK